MGDMVAMKVIPPSVKRGDIYYAELGDIGQVVGCEQSGRRPVLVIQNNKGNKASPTTIVAVLTTKFKKWLPVHVFIPYFDNLPRNSMACLEQIRTIDKSRLQEYCGNVGDEIMDKVDQAISISLGTKNSQVYKQDAVEDETRRGISLGMIKRDTIFDGKVNDWLQFAEQQLVFFSEIEQYMVNLELTRNSLDEETDSILEYISSTNYNVTQGYKIYRMLRERRKQRSAIIDELEKLEFLIEKMDCEQMRQLYQEAIASMQKLSLETMRDNMMQQLLEEEVG